MNNKSRRPMPVVEYDGKAYSLRSRKTEIPDLNSMDRTSALIWINRNTTPRGRARQGNPLAGMGGAIKIN